MDIKSPFPGMDPWLEQHWGDVHQRIITYASDQLQDRLPGDLRARVEERVFVETPGEVKRTIYPDVHIVQRKRPPTSAPSDGGIAVMEPLVIEVPHEEVTEGYIEIREARTGGRVITVIEVLSPSNKDPKGPGRTLYEAKQEELREAGTNLVEIDLVRGGRHVLRIPEAYLQYSVSEGYKVCVSRGIKPGRFEIYPLPLRDRLPGIKIPLRPTDPDVALDLQALIDAAYHNGAYDDIDYGREPIPLLNAEDAKWADELLRAKGLRGS